MQNLQPVAPIPIPHPHIYVSWGGGGGGGRVPKLSPYLGVDDPMECAHKDGLVGVNAGRGAARKSGVSYLPRDHLNISRQLNRFIKNAIDKSHKGKTDYADKFYKINKEKPQVKERVQKAAE